MMLRLGCVPCSRLLRLLGCMHRMLAIEVGAEGGGEQVEKLLALTGGQWQLRMELLCQGAECTLADGGGHGRCAVCWSDVRQPVRRG